MAINSNTDDLISFNQLFNEYQKRYVRFANTYVRDLPAAEDIVVESLMYYWENRHSLQEKDLNIPAYILTTIKHKCLNYLRHMQVHEEYSQDIQSYTEWELNTRIATLQACEPYDLFASEVKEIVQQTLKSLPEKTREIFIMSRYENKSYKEIAEKMGMTTKGVEFHVSKALKALHVSLKDYFPFFLYLFCKM
ncbi:RNA polymerase sigma-70 factor [Bacteroides sedimenti]|uniref:DNA-directed RNA polymerase sigma-70 factor n=1 Tax=Bacteroides sedimenti TaxID=2136147 RepID=A0ABN6Z3R5_9BACE